MTLNKWLLGLTTKPNPMTSELCRSYFASVTHAGVPGANWRRDTVRSSATVKDFGVEMR